MNYYRLASMFLRARSAVPLDSLAWRLLDHQLQRLLLAAECAKQGLELISMDPPPFPVE